TRARPIYLAPMSGQRTRTLTAHPSAHAPRVRTTVDMNTPKIDIAMTLCHHDDNMSTEPAADGYRALLAEVYELAGLSRRQSDAEAAIHGSTAARWLTMSTISDTDLTVASIARRLGLPRQAVHRVVDDL